MRMRSVSLLLAACAITAITATPSWAATKTFTLYVLQTGTCEDRDHTRWVLSLRKSNGLECATYTDEGEPGAFRATENYVTDRKIARQLTRTGRVTAAVREDAFPAVRIRGRYIVPAKAIERLIESAIELDGSVDLKQLVAIRGRSGILRCPLTPGWR